MMLNHRYAIIRDSQKYPPQTRKTSKYFAILMALCCFVVLFYYGIFTNEISYIPEKIGENNMLHYEKYVLKTICDEQHSKTELPVPDLDWKGVGCQKDLYITVSDLGRLGNKLCAHLSIGSLGLIYNIKAAMPRKAETPLKKMFQKMVLPSERGCCDKKINHSIGSILNLLKRNMTLSDIVKSSSKTNSCVHITQYPCYRLGIAICRKTLRNYFTFRDSLIVKAHSSLDAMKERIQMGANATYFVSVHVRRTDYPKYLINHNLTQSSQIYFENAFNYFRSRFRGVVFIIFSDDIKWCKEAFRSTDIYFLGNNDIAEPYLDFATISLCDHHIISDGTFSFTSAVLGKGLIAYNAKEKAPCPYTEEFIPISSEAVDSIELKQSDKPLNSI